MNTGPFGEQPTQAEQLNPEAGNHPVPSDARETQAALKAGEICRNRFPYFEQRYGVRGRRFTRSDSAWLVTLSRNEPAEITKQIQWLGRVLSSRGMPTVLLQTQLEILDEELTAVIPENKSEYRKLSQAAAQLRASRRTRFSDEQLDTFSAEFDRAVGPEWSVRFPHTGAMLVCAVADDLNGCEGVIKSLRARMTDAARFPAEWIAAVKTILAQVHRHASAFQLRSPA